MDKPENLQLSLLDLNDSATTEQYIQSKIELGDHKKLYILSNQLLSSDSESPKGWLIKGLSYYYNQEYIHAIGCFKKAEKLDVNDPLTKIYLIKTKFVQGKFLSSLKDLEEFSINDPKLGKLETFASLELKKILKGFVDWVQKKYTGTEMIQYLIRVIEIFNNLQFFREGEQIIQKTISTLPIDPNKNNEISPLQLKLLDFQIELKKPSVESSIDLLIEKYPKNANLHSLKGKLKSKQFRKEEALQCYQTCLSLEPENPEFILQHAEICQEIGFINKFSENIKQGNSVIQNQPKAIIQNVEIKERLLLYEEVEMHYSRIEQNIKKSVHKNINNGGFSNTGELLNTMQDSEFLKQLIEGPSAKKNKKEITNFKRMVKVEQQWMEKNQLLFYEKNILREKDNQEKVENYKKIFMRCFQLLDNTIMRYLSNDYNLKKNKVKSILSFIPLPWYIFKPLKALIKLYVWRGNRSQIDTNIRKYHDFFSSSILGDGAYLMEGIVNDSMFRSRILNAEKCTRVIEFKKENFVFKIQSNLENNIMRFLQKDEEILAFIDFELIKGLIQGNIVSVKDGHYDRRMEKLFYYMKNPMMADIKSIENKESTDKYAPDEINKYILEHTNFGDELIISAISYKSYASFSKIGRDLVHISIPKMKKGPKTICIEDSGKRSRKKLKEKIVISSDFYEFEVVIKVEGFLRFSDERKAFYYVEDLVKGKMNYREIFGENEKGRWVMIGKIGLFVD